MAIFPKVCTFAVHTIRIKTIHTEVGSVGVFYSMDNKNLSYYTQLIGVYTQIIKQNETGHLIYITYTSVNVCYTCHIIHTLLVCICDGLDVVSCGVTFPTSIQGDLI